MGWLYLGTAIAGAGLTFGILIASLAWSGVFFILLVAMVVAMMAFGDNKFHAWLDRCLWGRLESERYADADAEKQEYELAVRAG